MHATTDVPANSPWKTIEVLLLSVSLVCSPPSIGLSAWLALNRLGVVVPLEYLWFILLFLAALPTAPLCLLCGLAVVWRQPFVLLWLMPASAYWVVACVESLWP